MKVLGQSSLSSKVKLGLDVAWYLSWLSVAVAILIGSLILLDVFPCAPGEMCKSQMKFSPIAFKMDASQGRLQSASGAVAQLASGSGELVIEGDFSTSTTLIIFAEIALLGMLLVLVIFQLRRIFSTFVQGTPFVVANTKSLQWIASSLLAMSVLAGLFPGLNAYLLSRDFAGEGIELVSEFNFSLTAIFAGVVLFILAEIFRIGNQLEDEKAHTV